MSRLPRQLLGGAVKNLLDGNKPSFIIIGVQKAGTSYLHHCLDKHPRLVGSIPKEIHYFDIEVNHNHNLEWYESHFKSFNSRNKLFFESTPSYLYTPNAAEYISNLYPSVKLIVVLRNPIVRSFSAWNMYRHMFENNAKHMLQREVHKGIVNPIYKYLIEGKVEFPSFRHAIEIELDLMLTNTSLEPAILRRGLYFDQLNEYYKHFSKGQLLVLGFKDLVSRQDAILNEICRFLEVPEFNFRDISMNAKNSGTYRTKMLEEDFKFLSEFYQEPNEKLFNLLGYIPNW